MPISSSLSLRKNRLLQTETLENRTLLDAGLGSEIAQFETEQELNDALIERAVNQYEWAFGTEVNVGPCGFARCWWPIEVTLDGGVAAPEFSGGGGDAARDFSDTNTQVAGVDEGDIVETDGNFIYILSNNTVTIVDVQNQEHPRVASRYELDNDSYANEMYLHGGGSRERNGSE